MAERRADVPLAPACRSRSTTSRFFRTGRRPAPGRPRRQVARRAWPAPVCRRGRSRNAGRRRRPGPSAAGASRAGRRARPRTSSALASRPVRWRTVSRGRLLQAARRRPAGSNRLANSDRRLPRRSQPRSAIGSVPRAPRQPLEIEQLLWPQRCRGVEHEPVRGRQQLAHQQRLRHGRVQPERRGRHAGGLQRADQRAEVGLCAARSGQRDLLGVDRPRAARLRDDVALDRRFQRRCACRCRRGTG